jgi:glycosyltransferase involved in cell wall biosynthesis
MVEGKRVGVVIPAYNEELLISATLAGIPAFVDRVFIVDDASKDSTVGLAHGAAADDPRIVVIVHERNLGVGAAVVTGYKRAIAEELDVVCVMNGDNQMDPDELLHLINPVVLGELDYAKANRLFSGEAWNLIPHYRYLGNAILSLFTKIASGYWHVADSQAGYTAISLEMLKQLDLDRIYPNYGYPNDMLVHLNVWSARVRDIPSKPIYGIGERSGIRLRKVIPRISWLLVNGFFWRMFQKYVIRDFHPLVFFYAAGFFTWFLGVVLAVVAVVQHFVGPPPNAGTAILVALMLTFGVLFTLFAMWFDMETNKDLR